MPFHLTTGARDDIRVGPFDGLAEAMASHALAPHVRLGDPMFIVEAPGGADSGGRLVAGLDSEMGWVELDDDGFEPQWWSQVSERVRRWIIDRPREALPDWMIAAGVGATSPYWVSAEQSGEFYLPTGLQDWGLARRLIETYNAG